MIQQRAARIGFDWPAARPVIAKLAEEIAELEAELDSEADPDKVENEMGDILFAAATRKFERRLRRVEALAAERGIVAGLDVLEALWQEVKGEEDRG